MMAGKIHRATVTEANLDYVGSITLDPVLMDAAGILPYEQVHVLDVTNGSRLETYTITGRRGSGEVCINGAAAHLVHEGDLVIIVAYQHLADDEAHDFVPRQVHVDAHNRILNAHPSMATAQARQLHAHSPASVYRTLLSLSVRPHARPLTTQN